MFRLRLVIFIFLHFLPLMCLSLQNAFSSRLGSVPGFNMFNMFVVDFMHEVELGAWKSLFIHLIRILQAVSPTRIAELDRRLVQLFTSVQILCPPLT